MAVIISDSTNAAYDGNLSTVNGFYRVEAGEIVTINTNLFDLATPRTQAVTFANAGNCKGVVFAIQFGGTSQNIPSDRDVRVDLQEIKGTATLPVASPGIVTYATHGLSDGDCVSFATAGTLPTGVVANVAYYAYVIGVDTFYLCPTAADAIAHTNRINFTGTSTGTHTLWVTRTTTTKTWEDISGQTNYLYNCGDYVTPFKFATPYAVDTNAGKWRFRLVQEAGTSAAGSVNANRASSGGLYYATWCDTQISHTDDDQMIVCDSVTIDKTCSFGNTLTNDPCILICSNGTDISTDNVCLLKWENVPAASYTMTIKGNIQYGTHGGMRIGTSAQPIPLAKPALIVDALPLVGAYPSSGSYAPITSYTRNCYHSMKNSLFMYGEISATRETTLAADAAGGQKVIVTSADMSASWTAGDLIYVFKCDAATYTDQYVIRTISKIVGTTITLDVNLGAKRLAGGHVINMSKYAIKWSNAAVANYTPYILGNWSNLVISGVSFYGKLLNSLSVATVATVATPLYSYPDAANAQTRPLIEYSLGYYKSAMSWIGNFPVHPSGMTVQYNHSPGSTIGSFLNVAVTSTIKSGDILIKGNIGGNVHGPYFNMVGLLSNSIIRDNYAYNTGWGAGSGYGVFQFSGYKTQFIDNVIFGHSGNGAYCPGGANIGITITGGSITKCNIGILAGSTAPLLNTTMTNVTFSTNTKDVDFTSSGVAQDLNINSPTGAVTVNTANFLTSTPESFVRVTDNNDVTNADMTYQPYGIITRTGTSLTDTTTHTAGGFAARFESLSSTLPLEWKFTIPTGNIQNKTMMVGVWCNINNAAYWAGTNQLPRLTIDYDNGTTAYVQAAQATGWQFLPLPFTPLTTYGQITVTVSTMTDATTSDAYVYFDDFKTLFPAEAPLDTQTMDLWANGLPVTPPIATVLSANDVWSAATSTMTGTGTIGEKVSGLKTPKLLIGGQLILSK